MEPFKIVEAIEAIKTEHPTPDFYKTLFIACTQSENSQNFIIDHLPQDYFSKHLKTGDEFLIKALSLAVNLSVNNARNQKILFEKITPLISGIEWTTLSARYMLLFLVTCTQPGTVLRDEMKLDYIIPFFKLWAEEDEQNLDEDFDFHLINIITCVAQDAVDYAINLPIESESIAYAIFDLLHDSCEEFHNRINHKALIEKIMDVIFRDNISPKQARSNLIGVFAALIGANEDARLTALDLGCLDKLKDIKKTDINDPALLEWSVAAVRFMTQFVDPPDKPNIFKPSQETQDQMENIQRMFGEDDFM